VCHLEVAPESAWVTDHDMSGFGVSCRPYTHEELVALNWRDLRALLRLGDLLPIP
jgi:hypothetical protein